MRAFVFLTISTVANDHAVSWMMASIARLEPRTGHHRGRGRKYDGLSIALVLATLASTGCASLDLDGDALVDLKRAQRHKAYTTCFNRLYDPANPYHNMIGMQRACSKYAKAQVP